MKKLVNKISFHIPGFKFVDGKMLNVYIGEFKEALSKELSAISVEAFFSEKAVGYYKGREYPQEIITVFYNDEDVLSCFINAVSRMREALKQESFAYELNGTMYVYSADEFYAMAGKCTF